MSEIGPYFQSLNRQDVYNWLLVKTAKVTMEEIPTISGAAQTPAVSGANKMFLVLFASFVWKMMSN